MKFEECFCWGITIGALFVIILRLADICKALLLIADKLQGVLKMLYMQIKAGQKLHLVYEPGEGKDDQSLIRADHVSAPICGRGFDENGNFRMTINVPLANGCKNCRRVFDARH